MAGHEDSSSLKGNSGISEDRFCASGGGRPAHKGWHAFTKLMRDAHSTANLAPFPSPPPQVSSHSFPVLGGAHTRQQAGPRRKSMLDTSSVYEIRRGDEASRSSTLSFAVAVKSSSDSDSDMVSQKARTGSNALVELHHPCGGNERLKRLAQLEVVKSAFPWAETGLLEDVLGSCNWKAETAMKCLMSMEEHVSDFTTPTECGGEECLAVGRDADNEEVDLYKQFRGDALRVSRKQARHARSAMTAFKAGDHERARVQSRVAREEGQVAAELNAQAAVHILNVRNHHWDNISSSSSSSSASASSSPSSSSLSSSSSSSSCTVWELDLHGLHASEAIEAVCNRLATLESSLVHPHAVTHATATRATTSATTTTSTSSTTTPPPPLPPRHGSTTQQCTTHTQDETLAPDLSGVKLPGFQGSARSRSRSRSSTGSEHPVEKLHASSKAEAAAAVADATWETGDCALTEMPFLPTTSPARKPPSLVTSELHVITGEGQHSRDGAILPSAVMSWLVENKYNVRQISPGVVAVQPKKKFGAGASIA